ncbi:MAG: tRNA (adenosine(37)-N6)-dimethylallyltransferase MiaA [Allopontixanthobacter sediminis]
MSTKESPTNLAGGTSAELPPVALIAGPTASGKSDLAVELALALGKRGRKAAVINADSAQVYRDLQILSARPSEDDMRGTDHRLFGTWDGAKPCSAGNWAEAAKREIADLHRDGGVPILVGGTGLYLRTLLDGIAPIPEIDPHIRAEVRALPQVEARRVLLDEDPHAAAKLAPADNSRTSRALEVVRSTGKPLHHWQQYQVGGIGGAIDLHPLILLPDRTVLYDRCDSRFAAMLEAGAAEEVEALVARNLDPALPVMRAIGVREIASWLRGDLSEEAMITAGQLATRQYSKRQYTWFRNQPPAEWPRAIVDNDSVAALFARILR